MFSSLPLYAGDPILSMQQDFRRDARADKVNLSIGLYYDEMGQVPMLASVRAARAAPDEQRFAPGYLPMGGDPRYCSLVRELIFGEDDARIATVQSVGGSGALKVGADFLHGLYPGSGVWVSAPTWDNHRAIFEGAGFAVGNYPYFDAASNAVAFDEMMDFVGALPPQGILVLHPCCHNPTGMDLTEAQWDALIPVLQSRQLIPFLDMAYQGYAQGMEQDCHAMRRMRQAGMSFLVSHSFSKIFSLYSERCGSLSVVCESAGDAARVHGQLEFTIRRNYSSPPATGARIVAGILGDAPLRALWLSEVEAMRDRIKRMRLALHDAIATHSSRFLDWDFLLAQRGLFSYAPVLGQAARALREEHGIYILDSGRICVAGLTAANVARVAHAFSSIKRAASGA
jgi:aromatic-amino-acid transaminase